MIRDHSGPDGRWLRWLSATLLLLLLFGITPASADPFEQTRHVFINVSNADGVKYDLDGATYGGPSNTYYIKADGGGLNELHITADAANDYGQVTTSTDQSGVFYVSNTGGRGFTDDIVLLLAVNGTVPDDFAMHIKTSGYTWTPSSVIEQIPTHYTYVDGAVNEIFTREDFLYGPQTWMPGPGSVEPYLPPGLPLYEYQDVADTGNTFSLMFIDLKVGNMKPSTFGTALTDNGVAKVEYSFENLETFAAFNSYGWCLAANQGQGISWTNRVNSAGETVVGTSGYAVVGIPPVPTSIAVTPAAAEVEIGTSMQFAAAALDQNDRTMSDIAFTWSSSDETVGTVNATGYFTALAAGTTTVTAANGMIEGTAEATVTAAPSGPRPLPDYNNVFFTVANDAGANYNAFGNNTYNVRFEGYDRGLNALHISTDPAVNFGQVTVSENQSGTFYATDSGGKGYEDDILLMVAVNGTIPDTFRLHITADGYTWTPNPVSNMAPSLDNVTYQPVSLDETFTRDDFRYGPQIWKPTGNGFDYPIHFGQNLSDTANTFQVMFIDLNAGVLRPNTALENQGAVRINYTVENLDTFVAFNVYGYCKNSNNGDEMVAWTNAVLEPKVTSGYSVIGAGASPVPSRIEVSPAAVALAVGEEQQFAAIAYDADGNVMTGITVAWSGSNETVGTVNETGSFTAFAAGTTTLTASYGTVDGTATVTVTSVSSGSSALPAYNYIFVKVANDDGVKYNSYLNNTYNIRFSGAGRGLNAHHITTDPVSAPYGQVTNTTNRSGVFYVTDTGGSGFADNVVLMIAANGTIPDDFRIHIRTSGYNWTPMAGLEVIPPQSAINYVEGAVDETFTKEDLIYGPQTWKPSGETTPYPIYEGQNMSDAADTFRCMFVDVYVGQLGTNSGMSGLNDAGAVKVEYTIENMPESVVFNSYCWNSNANQGPSVIAWTNNLIGGHNGNSGYSVRIDPDAAPTVLLGDANDDGTVNQADTLRVLKQLVGLSAKPASDTELFTKTDVHRNGMIEVGDALFIAQYNAGLRDAWFALR